MLRVCYSKLREPELARGFSLIPRSELTDGTAFGTSCTLALPPYCVTRLEEEVAVGKTGYHLVGCAPGQSHESSMSTQDVY